MDDNHDLLLYTPSDLPDLPDFPSSSDLPHPEKHQTQHSTDLTASHSQNPSLPLPHQMMMAASQGRNWPHQSEGQLSDAEQSMSSDAFATMQHAGQLPSLQGHHPGTEVDFFLNSPQTGSVEPNMPQDTWRTNPQPVHSGVSFTTSTSSGQTLAPSQMALPGSLTVASSNFNLPPGMQYMQMASLPDGNVLQNVPLQPGVFNPSSTFKPRLRWTDELHDKFVDAVEKLGGYSRATPSAILKAMGVDRLELGHVKSHLQKYRTEKKRNKKDEEPEGKSAPSQKRVKMEDAHESQVAQKPVVTTSHGQLPHGGADGRPPADEAIDLEAALKKQYELQQMLAEQLEAQKKLQSSLEQHTKYISCLMRTRPNAGEDNPELHAETDPSVDLPVNK
ncbi:uncharacterized protein LOC142357676 [Convolutriloba macropyga]|uniref:uncharacterized protein LOC142357676 n=1 Tax=Convolutriloba macropyga TaxID=536237 RepID=UPI003F5274FE